MDKIMCAYGGKDAHFWIRDMFFFGTMHVPIQPTWHAKNWRRLEHLTFNPDLIFCNYEIFVSLKQTLGANLTIIFAFPQNAQILAQIWTNIYNFYGYGIYAKIQEDKQF